MSDSAQNDARDESSRAADTDRIQEAQQLSDDAAQGHLQMSDCVDRRTKAEAAT
jgi:hypothetical protein